jgi:hypothetical protein
MQNFETIESYLIQAQKMICRFGGRHVGKLLKDDDCVGDVAGGIMKADWQYRENNLGKDGKICGVGTFRCVYAKNIIFSIIKNWTKLGKIKIKPITESIPDKTNIDPSKIVEQNDYISHMLNNSHLSDTQKGCIEKYYFYDMTLQETGNYYNFSCEAARKNIKNGCKKINETMANYYE